MAQAFNTAGGTHHKTVLFLTLKPQKRKGKHAARTGIRRDTTPPLKRRQRQQKRQTFAPSRLISAIKRCLWGKRDTQLPASPCPYRGRRVAPLRSGGAPRAAPAQRRCCSTTDSPREDPGERDGEPAAAAGRAERKEAGSAESCIPGESRERGHAASIGPAARAGEPRRCHRGRNSRPRSGARASCGGRGPLPADGRRRPRRAAPPFRSTAAQPAPARPPATEKEAERCRRCTGRGRRATACPPPAGGGPGPRRRLRPQPHPVRRRGLAGRGGSSWQWVVGLLCLCLYFRNDEFKR